MKPFSVVAPGRLCLFGEHQDYLHLPVISLAIPLATRIHVTPLSEASQCGTLELQVPQLGEVFRYDLDNLPPRQQGGDKPDFALAAIHEVIEEGWRFPVGATCVSTTDIVMNAGCSSSTSFCVAWVLALSELAGVKALDPLTTAKLAHRAEVIHFGAPGGTMDHLSIALGGSFLRIGPGMWEVERLPCLGERDGVWVLADSGDPKDTIGHLKRCKGDRLAILEKLGGSWDSKRETVSMDEEESQLLDATLTNRACESDAATLWRMPRLEHQIVGDKLAKLMLRHHSALRDGLKLSTTKLEQMREAAIGAGAWGYKLVGSGGGGCAVAWAPREAADDVSKSMMQISGKNTWIIDKPSRGARIVHEREDS